jgi:hypothetical protein
VLDVASESIVKLGIDGIGHEISSLASDAWSEAKSVANSVAKEAKDAASDP